jgi:DNA-binding Lrp family transcriptional regulator
MTDIQSEILRHIGAEPRTARQIADAAGVEYQPVASAISKLIKDGDVKRIEIDNPEHGKARGARPNCFAYYITEQDAPPVTEPPAPYATHPIRYRFLAVSLDHEAGYEDELQARAQAERLARQGVERVAVVQVLAVARASVQWE